MLRTGLEVTVGLGLLALSGLEEGVVKKGLTVDTKVGLGDWAFKDKGLIVSTSKMSLKAAGVVFTIIGLFFFGLFFFGLRV